MIYQGNHVMNAALQKTRRAHCDWVFLYRCNAVLSGVRDRFQESETIRERTGFQCDRSQCFQFGYVTNFASRANRPFNYSRKEFESNNI